jgi:hypothetical protein
LAAPLLFLGRAAPLLLFLGRAPLLLFLGRATLLLFLGRAPLLLFLGRAAPLLLFLGRAAPLLLFLGRAAPRVQTSAVGPGARLSPVQIYRRLRARNTSVARFARCFTRRSSSPDTAAKDRREAARAPSVVAGEQRFDQKSSP